MPKTISEHTIVSQGRRIARESARIARFTCECQALIRQYMAAKGAENRAVWRSLFRERMALRRETRSTLEGSINHLMLWAK